MPHRKRKSKSKRAAGEEPESETLTKAPHAFVIKRGQVGKSCGDLMLDFRRVLEPFTATNLKIRKKNVIKDFVSIASSFNVSHMIVFTKTTKSQYVRICRVPRGPTLTYKILEYSLAKDVVSSLSKPLVYSGLFQLSPLIVMNSFSGEDLQQKLSTSMWRNLFPSIDVNKISLNAIRRCVLLNYNQDTKLIDFRHYAIKVKPVGVSKAVKKMLMGKKIPDLGHFTNIDEFLTRDLAFTESEGEADEHDETRQVTLPQQISSRGNMLNEKSAIRLVELGPRMTLELIKVEDGLMAGEVLYHSIISKTKTEMKLLKQKILKKTQLKMSRKREQEANVKRKMKAKETKTKHSTQVQNKK